MFIFFCSHSHHQEKQFGKFKYFIKPIPYGEFRRQYKEQAERSVNTPDTPVDSQSNMESFKNWSVGLNWWEN